MINNRISKIEAALAPRGASTAPVMREYADRPVDFARDVLGLRVWSHQRRALEAVRDHRRVAWRSSHGVGKSWSVAALAIWWICTRAPALVIMTAPGHRQIEAVDWRALSSLYRNARVPLGGELLTPAHGWRFPDDRLVVGFSANEAERLQGFHSPNLLAIVDEASGVEAPIYEALKGALTGAGARLLLVGNPTQVSGEFYEAFNAKAHLYHALHTSAFDVPNVSGEEAPVDGLVDRAWIDEIAADYGEGSAAYAVRVLGEFPDQASNSVIALADVEAAQERYAESIASFDNAGSLELGVDVARFGDDETVIVARRGRVIREPMAFRGLDSVAVVDKVQDIARRLRKNGERVRCKVDSVGVGAGVLDMLRQVADLDVVDVNAGVGAPNREYARLRDQLWFSLRDWLKTGAIPRDARLAGELSAVRYSYDASQRIKVESKDEIRKTLRRSPDRADALALAVWRGFGGPATSRYTAPGYARESDLYADEVSPKTAFERSVIERIEWSGCEWRGPESETK